MTANAIDSSVADREIISSRAFAAPREKLYSLFSEPAKLAKWWGPNGFTNMIHKFELLPGGEWLMTMHGPGGAKFENRKEFREVVPNERVVFCHFQPMHLFTMSLIYEDEGAGTRLTWRMLFETAEQCQPVRGFIEQANEENFDRLAAMF